MEREAMSNMKRWLREQNLSSTVLASEMNQSRASIIQKTNGNTHWQYSDLEFLFNQYGLSSDFVLDLVPYDEYMKLTLV